jgi:hypothetical protein
MPNAPTHGAIATTWSARSTPASRTTGSCASRSPATNSSPATTDALIATGFHRAGPIHLVSGNQDEEMNRQEVLTEMAGGVGATFMGLTVGCAKCHNHKFDPILQADYYRLQAVFAATEGKDIEIAPAEQKAAYEAAKKAYTARLEPIKKQIAAIEKPYRDRLREEKKAKLDRNLREASTRPRTSGPRAEDSRQGRPNSDRSAVGRGAGSPAAR